MDRSLSIILGVTASASLALVVACGVDEDERPPPVTDVGFVNPSPGTGGTGSNAPGGSSGSSGSSGDNGDDNGDDTGTVPPDDSGVGIDTGLNGNGNPMDSGLGSSGSLPDAGI